MQVDSIEQELWRGFWDDTEGFFITCIIIDRSFLFLEIATDYKVHYLHANTIAWKNRLMFSGTIGYAHKTARRRDINSQVSVNG